ncbi:hypothetical protein OG455_41645 [Kitasatospora sp. NBC_01287]|uniref:hypothetical protein n=1 Tax=Kitasatospora sp. NBC_01287 TaxID=2903573 RepID=UPI00225B1180|nr:hypothetical protein [Kitasatospora sp. NBC_01287]MCX4751760.1 hypothetical protein [Kitasatospora sp. NBC_01287]MCX4751948.1 hypothetical protein [Kitasatospora sp. NBC_01287]
MTDDLRARIECALGLHPAIRDGQTVPLADTVMEIVQPIADECDQLAARVAELEQQAASTYAAQVNAPLRPDTINALNERLTAGDCTVRKVQAPEDSP